MNTFIERKNKFKNIREQHTLKQKDSIISLANQSSTNQFKSFKDVQLNQKGISDMNSTFKFKQEDRSSIAARSDFVLEAPKVKHQLNQHKFVYLQLFPHLKKDRIFLNQAYKYTKDKEKKLRLESQDKRRSDSFDTSISIQSDLLGELDHNAHGNKEDHA